MRVLMLGWEFPPHISGGLGTACAGISKGLLNCGVDITMVLPKTPYVSLAGINFLRAGDVAPLSEVERKQKQNLYACFKKLITVDTCINPYFSEDEYKFQKSRVLHLTPEQQDFEYDCSAIHIDGAYGDNLFAEVGRYAMAGTRIGLRGGFDVVYAHDWMTMLAGVEASHQSSKPLVLHVHSTEFDRAPKNQNQTIINIETYAMAKANLIVTVSNRSKDILVAKYGVDARKIKVVHNAITIPKPIKQDEKYNKFNQKIVLFMGRITEQKGPEYFIQAAKRVLQRNKDIRFVMAGCGNQLPLMIELVAKERMESHFHFTGFLRGDEVSKIFNICDLFVMPSVSEPFGLATLEAMSHGVPTIVSNQSGVAEVVANALKIDFWDIEAMSNSILSALENKDLGMLGAEEVKSLGWDLPAKKLLSIFNEVLNG